MSRSTQRVARTCVLLVPAVSAACCITAPLHPVDVADVGHVTATLSGQIGDSLQGEAQLGYGVAPHVQLEASGAVGAAASGLGYSVGGGVRGEVPFEPRPDGSSALSMQIAGLYRHTGLSGYDSSPNSSSCDPGGVSTSWTCVPNATIESGGIELGLVGRVQPGPTSLGWGIWAAGAMGNAWGTAPEGGDGGLSGAFAYRTTIARMTLSASLEQPLDRSRRWSLLAGATFELVSPIGGYAAEAGEAVNPEPNASWGLGAGLVLRP
jgi:hypothetical protein